MNIKSNAELHHEILHENASKFSNELMYTHNTYSYYIMNQHCSRMPELGRPPNV
jgi:hypothetical protein